MTRSKLLAVPREEPIIGHPIEVENALTALRLRGDLISRTRPQYLANGQVVVIAKLLDRTPPQPRWRPDPVVATVTAAVLAAAALVSWLVFTTVMAAGRWVGDHLAEVIVGGVVLLVALTYAGRKGCEITVTHRRH